MLCLPTVQYVGERRKDQRAPQSPRMQEMHTKLVQANAVTSTFGNTNRGDDLNLGRDRKTSI